MFEKIGHLSKKFNSKLVFVYIAFLLDCSEFFPHQFPSLKGAQWDGEMTTKKPAKKNNGKFFTDFFVSKLRNRRKAFFHQDFDKLFLLFKQVLVLSAALPSNSHWNKSLRVNNCESLANNNCCNYWRHLSFPWNALCFIEWRCKGNSTNRPLRKRFTDFLTCFCEAIILQQTLTVISGL